MNRVAMRALRSLLPALALLAFAAPSAPAAVPGVNIGTSQDPQMTGKVEPSDVQKAHALGAKSFRIFVDWADFESSPGAIDVTRMGSLRASVAEGHRLGMKAVLVVFHTPQWAARGGSSNRAAPPAGFGQYASFVGRLAGELRDFDPVWEIWNEQDEQHFWDIGRGGGEPVFYAGLLKSANAAIKAQDPQATVLFGALTGNNYEFFEQSADQGGLTAGDLDGVAVHTDTACLVNAPTFYVRNVGANLDGRINRFSFLGFREVKASMDARGMGHMGIWMTELGWSTFTGACEVPGVEPGRKGGVTREQQAAFTTQAYQCLANYPYVVHGLVFDMWDRGPGRTGQYGIIGKPAEGAFREAAAANGWPGGSFECGDFTPPSITEMVPLKEFSGPLRIRAKASDPSGVTRMTFRLAGQSKEIRNFTGDDVGNDKVVDMTWDAAKNLPTGNHTLVIEAIDFPSNKAVVEIPIRKIDPSKLKQTQPTGVELTSITIKKGKATVVGYVTKTHSLQLRGKVQAVWEARRPVRTGKGKKRKTVMRWKKVHGGLKAVKISGTGKRGKFTFTQPLKYSKYRLKVVYLGKSPYLASTSKTVSVAKSARRVKLPK
jgi:hypothetical protein